MGDGTHDQAPLLAGVSHPVAHVHRRVEKFLRLLVGHVFNALHEVAAPDVTDDPQVRQRGQALTEVRTDPLHVPTDVLTLENGDVLQRGGTAHGMARVGEAVGEHRPLGLGNADHVIDLVGDDGGRQRGVRRGQTLGRRDDVGHDPEGVLAGEHVAETPEGGHHLVGHVQDPVLGAGLTHALQVAGRRHEHAAGTHDRLGEEAGHVLGPESLDLGPELDNQLRPVLLRRGALRSSVQVGARHPLDERLADDVETNVVVLHAGQRHGHVGGPVVPVGAGDQHLLLGLAEHVEVVVDEAHRGVVGHRPTRAVQDVVQRPRSKAGQH